MAGMEFEPKPDTESRTPGSAGLGKKGHRTLLVILVCAAWAFLPSFPGMPKDWHSPWMIALIASTAIPVTAVFLIAFAPKIHRFGRWLDSTFGPDAREL